MDELTIIADFPEHLYDQSVSGPAALLVIYGENIGKSYYIEKEEQTIGRSDTSDIHLDQDSVSRDHAVIVSQSDRILIRDTGSTNGVFLNGRRIETAALHDGDRIHVGETILKFISTYNLESEYHQNVYRLMTVDDLTQAFNRQYFLSSLNREISRALRYHRVFSLVIGDIDHFKSINDTHGHLAGDYVLKEFVAFVTQRIRRNDVLCRYGGDEFAIILPETNRDQALYFCEKIRAMVAEHTFRYKNRLLPVTISLGVKHFEPSDTSKGVRQLIAEADKYLYDAKQAGRNRVCG